MAVTALKKTESIPNGQLTANLPIGDIYCVMYYSPIAQQTAHIIAAEKAIEPTTKINIQILNVCFSLLH